MRWTHLAAGALCAALTLAAAPGAELRAHPGHADVATHLAASRQALQSSAAMAARGEVAPTRRALGRARGELAAATRHVLRMEPSVATARAARIVGSRRAASGRRALGLMRTAPAPLRPALARSVRADAAGQARLAGHLATMPEDMEPSDALRAARAGAGIAGARRALARAIERALADTALPGGARAELQAARTESRRPPLGRPLRATPPAERRRVPAPPPDEPLASSATAEGPDVVLEPPPGQAVPAGATPDETIAIPEPAEDAPLGPAAPVVVRDVPFAMVEGADGPRSLLLHAYLPGGERLGARPAVLVIHGGAWRGGRRLHVEPQALALAERGFVAFSIQYRRDPRVLFPDQIEDLRAAVRWIRANAAAYGVDPARIGAFGVSAGGNLAMLLGTLGEGPLDSGDRVAAVASWSGPTDLRDLATEITPNAVCSPTLLSAFGLCDLFSVLAAAFPHRIMGCPIDELVAWHGELARPAPCPEAYEQGSPRAHVTPDDPPMLLAHAESDPLVPLRELDRMVPVLEAADVPVTALRVAGDGHAHALHDEVFERTADFFARRLAGATT